MSTSSTRPDRTFLLDTESRPVKSRRYDTAKHQILLIEHRDEVFARLDADLRRTGFTVRRSLGYDYIRAYSSPRFADQVLCYTELPEESGWLIAAKLRLYDPFVRIRMYSSYLSKLDRTRVLCSGVEELVGYRGDLLLLAELLIDQMIEFHSKMGDPY